MIRLFRYLLGGGLLALLPQGVCSGAFGADAPASFVSRIAPDFDIVTEVSLPSPYMGQQFSVLYRLRARRAPAAVDINPQQYRGFWTEAVPVPAQSVTTARTNRQQGGVEYLLRQVIAFPLMEGTLQLPPLSVKIKRAGSLRAAREQWDLEGASSPVEITVRPLPPGPSRTRGFYLVGSAAGNLTAAAGGSGELELNMEGTANLALLQPGQYLRESSVEARVRLSASDPLIQTIEKGGLRQLSMTQRMRWRIVFPESFPRQGLGPIVMPLFDPEEERWKEVRIEGMRSSDTETAARREPAPSEGGEGRRSSGWGVLNPQGFLIALAVVLATGGAVLIAGRRRKRAGTGAGPEDRMAALQKQLKASPRAFLDGAHRLLERVALERARRHDLGSEDTRLDRCWVAVQRYRFSREALPLETARELMKSIRQLLHE